jgi:hypothetical protein
MLLFILSVLSGCSKDDYPNDIEWDNQTYNKTNEVYSEDEVSLVKIGEYEDYEVYEEIEMPYNSKFLKTEEGYLHYKIEGALIKKPNIYLYPEIETKVDVKIEFEGEITCSYPTYDNGWKVIAKPDGKLISREDGNEYSYLFWEGIYDTDWDLSKGYVIKGEETADFLRDKLSYMGLIPDEYNEFIVYWLPEMEKNKYNLITFVNEEYSKDVILKVNPQPDSTIRIFMVYKGLKNKIELEEPQLYKYERNGFTLVEWGGTELK